jgi:hypothetical protein
MIAWAKFGETNGLLFSKIFTVYVAWFPKLIFVNIVRLVCTA